MEENELTPFDDVAAYYERERVHETVFDEIAANEEHVEDTRPPTNILSLLTAVAKTDPDKGDIVYQLGQNAIEEARTQLTLGNEKLIRNQLALGRQQRELTGINKLGLMLGGPNISAADKAAVDAAYQRVMKYQTDERAQFAIEQEAVERIQTMAARDPVAARVLLDNLEKGDADKTVADFNIRLAILQQRAQELDAEYQQQGWGKTVLNFILNLIPTNYNFARSGVVGEGGLGSWLAVGEGLRNQSERLWNMPMDEFVKFTARDGELMKSIASNATTAFDITSDPGAAVDIMDALTNQTDHSRTWNNVWGGVEVATLIPWGRVATTTRSLMANGAPKDAVRNLDNAIRMMDEAGPDATARATGVTEREIAEESSVSAINPRPRDEVPLAEELATHKEAAERALAEIFSPPTGYRFNSAEELQNAFESTVDDIKARVGRPVKDFTIKQEQLPGGQQVSYVEYVYGKKDGHGFATEAAARSSARNSGFGGEVMEVLSTPKVISGAQQHLKAGRTVKVYHGTAGEIVGDLRASTNGKMGGGLYVTPSAQDASFYATRGTEGSQVLPLRINAERVFGYDNLQGWSRGDIDNALDEIGFNKDDFWKAQEEYLDTYAKQGDDLYRSGAVINALQDAAARNTTGNSMHGAEALNDALKARGYEGVAAKFGGKKGGGEEINIFDEAAVAPEFLPAEVFQDMTGQYFVRGRMNIKEDGFYTNDLHPPTQGFLSRMFGRWVRSSARITDASLHGRALEAGTYINRAHKVIQGNIMSTFGKLPKESREIIKQIALKGAQEERWFKPDELDFLTERLVGRRATPVEQDAYAKLRLYNDMEWELRNTSLYVDKVVKGQETVTFRTHWGEDISRDLRVDYEMNKVPTERVYDASKNVHYTKQNNPLSGDRLQKMKNDGYVMLQLDDPLNFPDGTVVNRVLIKKHELEIRPLQREQLAYAEGGHRMYADLAFVKQARKGKQPDTGTEYLLAPSTLRSASNIAEAKNWADTMNKAMLMAKEKGVTEQILDDVVFKNDPAYPTGREFLKMVDEGDINLNHPFEAVWDRELPTAYRQSGADVSRLYDEDELGINGYYRTTGRMYTSAKGEILRNTKGEIAEILDPYDALQRSLEQVTRKLGLQNYKIEAMDRFRATYEKYLDVQPNHRSTAAILMEAKVRPDIPVELRNNIEAQRDAILNVLRFETPRDKMARQMWQNTAEWVIGDGSNAARKFAHDAVWWWKEQNPISAIRGMVFDMKLGMFNPGQLAIQISTMFSATAMSPKFGMQGMASIYPLHRYLLSKGNENILDTFAKRGLWKTMGFSGEQEFKDYSRHLFNHGFADMNGSHIMINDFGPAAHFGSFQSKVNSAREQGRVFFYTAETWNRIVAYRIAWGETIEKGLRPSDMNFTSEVLRRADDYSFNMTNESAAFWQKGILSVPTQFWAYNVRMIDAMIGKRFTPAQKIRLATSQMALAGTAGIPVLAAYSEYLKKEAGGSPPIDSLQGMLDRGLIDYINYQMTGQDILIGERVGTGGWATEVVKGMFGTSEYGEKSFMDLVGGASYSIGKKTVEAFGSTLGAVHAYAAAESGADIGERALVGEKFVAMLKEVSTFSNATKAMLVHQMGMYKSNKGTVLVSDLPPSNSWYIALSFRPSKAQEIGYMMAWDKDKQESLKEVATQLRNWRQEAFTNADKLEENMAKANALIKLLPPADRRQVLRQTNSITDKSFYDHIERKVSEEQLREEMQEQMAEGMGE